MSILPEATCSSFFHGQGKDVSIHKEEEEMKNKRRLLFILYEVLFI